ncbi:GAF domain-containing protein [Couchioplanes caeruleus subsp. azureus]|uniref:GAF domain-containing protein n=1 Tax=Couchioplanes caeruleus TaxID=56438 RepID=UPI00360B9259
MLDHFMPDMSGLQVADLLRADPVTATLPMLMLSAAAPDNAVRVFDHVMNKPLRRRHLVDVTSDMLANAVATLEPTVTFALPDPLLDPARLSAAYTVLTGAGATRDHRALTTLAERTARLLNAPIAAVHLVLGDVVHVVAATGLNGWIARTGAIPTAWAPCSQVVRTGAAVVLRDTHDDPRHTDNPLLTEAGIRSYAGAPLPDGDGHVVATLCVMDDRPGRFAPGAARALALLARQGAQLL